MALFSFMCAITPAKHLETHLLANPTTESAKVWKNAFYFLGLPVVGLVYYNAYYVMPQHPERPEFVPYPHLRIRNRPFPWSDGDHSLFHNKYYNATSKGYDEGSEELHPGAHHHH